MERANRQGFNCGIRQRRPCNDLAAQRKDHRRRLCPFWIFRLEGEVPGDIVGPDEEALRADDLDTKAVEQEHEDEYCDKDTRHAPVSPDGKRHPPHSPLHFAVRAMPGSFRHSGQFQPPDFVLTALANK